MSHVFGRTCSFVTGLGQFQCPHFFENMSIPATSSGLNFNAARGMIGTVITESWPMYTMYSITPFTWSFTASCRQPVDLVSVWFIFSFNAQNGVPRSQHHKVLPVFVELVKLHCFPVWAVEAHGV